MSKAVDSVPTSLDRGLALQQWAQEQASKLQLLPPHSLSLTPLTGDAGFRRYFRVNTTPELLAVEAPVATENTESFLFIAQYLRRYGVHSPEVLAVDMARGYLLIEDFGDQLYLESLNPETVDSLYGEALITLLKIQRCPFTDRVPEYNADRLYEEMALFRDWFVPQLLGYSLAASENALIERLFNDLIACALEQPRVLVHRDFHSRNLLVRAEKAPGVIDFQDAVWGPMTYDLVSLLRDCYICWPQEDIKRWVLAYRKMAVDAEIMGAVAPELFLRWFDWMGLQRHIKVLGIFARLWLRDGKAAYLNDLPLVMRYTLEVASSYPEFQAFVDWFTRKLLPLVEKQTWYKTAVV